jgi:hypothetical protein
MLMHAAISFVTLTVRPEGLTGARLLASLLVSPATMWLLLAAVGVANRWRLSGQPLQTNLIGAVSGAARKTTRTSNRSFTRSKPR